MSEGVPEQPSVLVVGGPLDGHDVKLTPGLSLIVGSGRLANLRLDHPDIELAHIKIIWDDLGISMVDNGSRNGTWINGELVETAALLDGDTIEFSDPSPKAKAKAKGKGPAAPRVRLRIPKGSVPDPPPLPPPPPGEPQQPRRVAPPRPGAGKGKARRRKSGLAALPLPDVDPKLLAIGGGAILALVLGGFFVKRMLFTGPSLSAVVPRQADMGQTVTLTGSRFDGDAADNKVWFGTVPVAPTTASADSLQVQVPVLPAAGSVAVSVETGSGRSGSVSFVALAPLRVASVDPPGALPGDEVTLAGSGFADGLTLTVGGQPARVIKVEPQLVRFEMPKLEGARGSVQAVVASVSGRSTPPVDLYLGRLPIVAAVEPTRGVAGDVVRVRGAGFTADSSKVSFDAVPALVIAGDTGQLLVVAPPSKCCQPETLVPVSVTAGGRTSTDPAPFTIDRLVEGTWVPRFLAGAVGDGGTAGQATVGTELAPVLLLSAKDMSRSTGERALSVAKALNAAVDRARVGQPVAFEAREESENAAVALVGAPDVLVRVLPQDAAAYEHPPGLPARGAPPTQVALAQHWAALLTDFVTIGTTSGKPKATEKLGPPWSPAFAALRTTLPFQYGSGISSAKVIALPADLRAKLREAAFRVP